MEKTGALRLRNCMSQDALCSLGTLKTPLYWGKILQNIKIFTFMQWCDFFPFILQCGRQSGFCLGRSHLAQQFWTFSWVVPGTSAGFWGNLVGFFIHLSLIYLFFPLHEVISWWCCSPVVIQLMPGHVEGRSWHFISQCWLAVHKGDGQVERMLRVSTHGLTFFKVLFLITHLITL